MKVPRDKSFAALQRFAAALGWSPLRIYQRTIDDDPIVSAQRVITWYESGDCGNSRTYCCLQFNECPIGQTETYTGAVYAIRYRLCTGWHAFTLYGSAKRMAEEASRLGSWLNREWFDSLPKRREFRKLHPGCVGYTWSRIRMHGPPYQVVNAASGRTSSCAKRAISVRY